MLEARNNFDGKRPQVQSNDRRCPRDAWRIRRACWLAPNLLLNILLATQIMADEDQFFSAFTEYKEFIELQAKFLSVDLFTEPSSDQDREEKQRLQRLSNLVCSH